RLSRSPADPSSPLPPYSPRSRRLTRPPASYRATRFSSLLADQRSSTTREAGVDRSERASFHHSSGSTGSDGSGNPASSPAVPFLAGTRKEIPGVPPSTPSAKLRGSKANPTGNPVPTPSESAVARKAR